MHPDLTLLGCEALHQAYQAGLTDPLAVTRAHLERIAQRDPHLHAFIHVCGPLAMQQAQASAQRWAQKTPLGLLDGVVVALKDNIDVQGMACTAGTAAFAHRMPGQHAQVYQRLAQAGAVLLGKLNMHEAALGATTDNPFYGRCINPLREGHTPGGSSGGSAAAVADHLCVGALGTDTMGSVRIPAAYCGVYGFITSHGRLAMDGIVPLSPSLDAVGPLARSGADLAVLAACLLGTQLTSAPQASVWQGLRIGLLPQVAEVDLAPAVQHAWQALQQQLALRGAVFQTLHWPEWQPANHRVHALLMSEWEGAAYWQGALGPELAGLSPGLQKMLRYGANLSPDKRLRSQQAIARLRASAPQAFAGVDVLLLPTTPHTSFAHTEAAPVSQADLACLANLLGAPALSFPCPSGGLPVSCQMLAPPGQDERLLALARALDTMWAA